AAASGSRGKGRSGGSRRKKKSGLFSEDEIRELDDRFETGITAVQVVDLFTGRGIRLSEATFRKYVQQGLVPRSRRVGRKGKHRGSLGVYPAKTIRRINTIKQRMEEGFTIEEIQEHFLRYSDLVEGVEESLAELFDSLGQAIEAPRFDARAKRTLSKELEEAKSLADELVNRIGGIAETVAEPPSDRFRGSGAAGSAEELL
ncbi:MAG: MerR family transcriptional regulator, partial [Deltaproteobacteria bacterium]|nr:MerR family transcriptional regulator [Deltaproteobacteria bacterium]